MRNYNKFEVDKQSFENSKTNALKNGNIFSEHITAGYLNYRVYNIPSCQLTLDNHQSFSSRLVRISTQFVRVVAQKFYGIGTAILLLKVLKVVGKKA